MNHLVRVNEPIEVFDKRFNYFPKTFAWRGKTHYVRSVDRCWTVKQRRLLGQVERHCFRVRTTDAIYDLYQDLRQDVWVLDRMILTKA